MKLFFFGHIQRSSIFRSSTRKVQVRNIKAGRPWPSRRSNLAISGPLWWSCMRRRRREGMWLASFSPSPLLPLLPLSWRQTACVGVRIVILAFAAATTAVSGQFAALSPSSLLLPRLRCRHDMGCTLTVVCLGGGVIIMGVGDRITCRAPPSSSVVAIAEDTRGRAIAAVRTTRGL